MKIWNLQFYKIFVTKNIKVLFRDFQIGGPFFSCHKLQGGEDSGTKGKKAEAYGN